MRENKWSTGIAIRPVTLQSLTLSELVSSTAAVGASVGPCAAVAVASAAGNSADRAESTMPTAVGTVVLPSARLESEDSTTAGLPGPIVSTGGAKASSLLLWKKRRVPEFWRWTGKR